jgi:hypothetical protein
MADRSMAHDLSSASVSGKVAIFLAKPGKTVQGVEFYFDDGDQLRAPFTYEESAPFDMGTTAADRSAVLIDTSKWTVGRHRVDAVLKRGNLSDRYVTVRFKVTPGSVTASTTTAGPTSTPPVTVLPTTSIPVTSAPTTSLPTTTTTLPTGSWWKPVKGTTWQWQLSGTLDLSSNVQVYDIDGFDATAADVAAIHTKGAKAICYIETGSWENYRPDANAYPASVLGKTMGGYPDERYVDLRATGVLRPILDARLDMCKAKGFDAIEPDIDDSFTDVGASGIGFPVTYADQIMFNKMVADDTHARGMAIALKNGVFGDNPAQFVKDMEAIADFAVEESCQSAGKVCGSLKVFADHNKAVFHAEYLVDYSGSSKTNNQAALDSFCPVTKLLGFSSILKDASETLSAWRIACPQ